MQRSFIIPSQLIAWMAFIIYHVIAIADLLWGGTWGVLFSDKFYTHHMA